MREHVFETINVWSVASVLLTATGLAIWLKRATFRWIVVSLPFWVLANVHGAFMTAAVALTIGGMAAMAVGPTLPGRRKRRDVAVLPHMANGPLEPVTASTVYGGQKSRVIAWLTWVFAGLGIVLIASASHGVDEATAGGLGLSCLIIAVTFAGSNWFATRVRLRIDDRGLHSRVLFAEHTIPWTELAGLTLRYVFLPGSGVRIVYYVAFSPTREFSFTSQMKGSKELQSAIERASGLRWPEPEFKSTF